MYTREILLFSMRRTDNRDTQKPNDLISLASCTYVHVLCIFLCIWSAKMAQCIEILYVKQVVLAFSRMCLGVAQTWDRPGKSLTPTTMQQLHRSTINANFNRSLRKNAIIQTLTKSFSCLKSRLFRADVDWTRRCLVQKGKRKTEISVCHQCFISKWLKMPTGLKSRDGGWSGTPK